MTDFSTVEIPKDLTLDSPDIKKARIESTKAEFDAETTKRLNMLKLIEVKVNENKETGEEFEQVTGINQRGLLRWVNKYVPSIHHSNLPYPYTLDLETNLWEEQKAMRAVVMESTMSILESVLAEEYGLELVPNSIYTAVNSLARDYSANKLQESDETNPLIEVQEPNMVPFTNGMFNFYDNSIRPRVASDYIVNPLPYDILETTETDEDIQYIRSYIEWLTGESVDLVTAYMGFLFYRSQATIQTMMIFINGKTANGRNGKSELIKLMQAMLGSHKNYSNIKMAELADGQTHKFAKKDLQHKFANFDGDAGANFFKHTEDLKKISADDTILAQVKGKESVTFKSYARLVMATNDLPDFRDDSDGIKERWVLVPFVRKVTSPENAKMWNTPESKFSDANKKKHMYSKEALGKWAYYCIQEFKKLVATSNNANPFTTLMTDEAKAILSDMAYDNDPIQQFLDDSQLLITGDSKDYIPKNDLWEMYERYLGRSNGYGKVTFYKKLAQAGAITKASENSNKSPRRSIGGLSTYVIEGIKLDNLELKTVDDFPAPLSNGVAHAIDEETAEELNKYLEKEGL